MKVVCARDTYDFATAKPDLGVTLFGSAAVAGRGSVGATLRNSIHRAGYEPSARALDFLSIALSVVASDVGVSRSKSPDGWTREIDLHVAVSEPEFWETLSGTLEQALRFLTTDRWTVSFIHDPSPMPAPKNLVRPDEDCVVLLSGGLDSLIGAIDLVSGGSRPWAVSQTSQGDKATQQRFAKEVGSGLRHLQLNHNANCPGENERSQRARSIAFFAYGIAAATSLERYAAGDSVTMYVCENGFISLNPPLTGGRLGALSTRTTHPFFIGLLQRILDVSGIRVSLENPYQLTTKGEMLANCTDQTLLRQLAASSTSCGRFARNGYRHCGRCLPCLIRRASFNTASLSDGTYYRYEQLSLKDKNHALYDDVRSAAIAVAAMNEVGAKSWVGSSISTAQVGDVAPYVDVVRRGVTELGDFLSEVGVV